MQQISKNKYKTTHDWVRKMILWEFCKKLKFDFANKWFMHNPESIQENETHKLLFLRRNGSPNFGQTTSPSDSYKEKKIYRILDFAVPVDHRVKLKENGKRDKCLDLA